MTAAPEPSYQELLREIVDTNAFVGRTLCPPFEDLPDVWIQRLRVQIIKFARAPCSHGLRGEDAADAYARITWIQSFVERQSCIGALPSMWRAYNINLFNRLWTALRKTMSLEHNGADVWDQGWTQELNRSRSPSNNTAPPYPAGENHNSRAEHVTPDAPPGANTTAIVTPHEDQVAHPITPTLQPPLSSCSDSSHRSPTSSTRRSRAASPLRSEGSRVMEHEEVYSPSASLECAPSPGKIEDADERIIGNAVVPAGHEVSLLVTPSTAPSSPRLVLPPPDLTSSTSHLLLRYFGRTVAIPLSDFCTPPDQIDTAKLHTLHQRLGAMLQPPFLASVHKVVYIRATTFEVETDDDLQDCLLYARKSSGVQFEVCLRRPPEHVHVHGPEGMHAIVLDALLQADGSLYSASMSRLWSALSACSGVRVDGTSHILTHCMETATCAFVLETDDDLVAALIHHVPTGNVRFDMNLSPTAPVQLSSSQKRSATESIPRNTEVAPSDVVDISKRHYDRLVACAGPTLTPAQAQAIASALSVHKGIWTFQDDFGRGHILSSGGLESVVGEAGPAFEWNVAPGVKLCNWLNDEIINVHMAVSVTAYNRRVRASQGSSQLCITLASWFVSDKQTGVQLGWLRSLNDKTLKPRHALADMHALFFPVNRENAHWSLAIALPAERKVIIKDSSPEPQAMQSAAQSVVDLLTGLLGGPKNWHIDIVDTGSGQKNGYDCGAYVCLYVQQYLRMLSGEPDHPIVARKMQENRCLIALEALEHSERQYI